MAYRTRGNRQPAIEESLANAHIQWPIPLINERRCLPAEFGVLRQAPWWETTPPEVLQYQCACVRQVDPWKAHLLFQSSNSRN